MLNRDVWDVLPPGRSINYAWDQPSLRHHVEVVGVIRTPAELARGSAAQALSVPANAQRQEYDLDNLKGKHQVGVQVHQLHQACMDKLVVLLRENCHVYAAAAAAAAAATPLNASIL